MLPMEKFFGFRKKVGRNFRRGRWRRIFPVHSEKECGKAERIGLA